MIGRQVLPERQPNRAERDAAARAAHRRQIGPHARDGQPWQDPGLGPAEVRAAGGAWQARSGCGRTLGAGLTTTDPRKVKCPDCKERP